MCWHLVCEHSLLHNYYIQHKNTGRERTGGYDLIINAFDTTDSLCFVQLGMGHGLHLVRPFDWMQFMMCVCV